MSTYFISDIPFEIILVVNGFVTTLLLKDRLVSLLQRFDKVDAHTWGWASIFLMEISLYKIFNVY